MNQDIYKIKIPTDNQQQQHLLYNHKIEKRPMSVVSAGFKNPAYQVKESRSELYKLKTKFGHCNNCQKNSLNFGLCKYCDSYYLCADCIKNQKFDKNHDCTKVFNIEKSRASKSVVKFAPDLPNEKICRMCKNQLKGFKIKYTKDDNLCFDCWNNNKTKLTDQFELIAAGFCDFCGLTFKDNVDHCFHCIVCDSYDLCLKCYTNGYFSKKHTLNHPVLTKRTPWKYSQ